LEILATVRLKDKQQERALMDNTHIVTRETLSDNSTELTSFYFRPGANVYVFTYGKDGARKHTFIDSGDAAYQDRILPLLDECRIDSKDIERIIITHRHRDHIGLASLLAGGSGAKIMVHANLQGFVEGRVSPEELRWMGGLDPTELQKCDMEYLPEMDQSHWVKINGLSFPALTEPIQLGEAGSLRVLAPPQCMPTHSPDQVIAHFVPGHGQPGDVGQVNARPADEILFSGDLWLMKGPMFDKGLQHLRMHVRFGLMRMRHRMSGGEAIRRDPREQDAEAKEALKTGFSLIRVKPGHGEEFLGSRIIPLSLMADRDLLIKLGYPMDADKSIVRSKTVAPRVAEIREQAYADFIGELTLWREFRYNSRELSDFLVRIYQEQSGGAKLVQQDRMERRERIMETLARLKEDQDQPEALRDLAGATLSKVEKIRV
jgi:hypothetical protein